MTYRSGAEAPATIERTYVLTRSKLMGLALGLVAAMALAVPALASATLNGAGSTLVAPLMANWVNGFETSTGTAVKYNPVGSGEGIKQINARTVDFGASDAPMTPEQAGECGGCVTIPWALASGSTSPASTSST